MKNSKNYFNILSSNNSFTSLIDIINDNKKCYLSGVCASFYSFLFVELKKRINKNIVFILDDKESAAYFFNDFENVSKINNLLNNLNIYYFPTSYKKIEGIDKIDNFNFLKRSEVLNEIQKTENSIIITYSEAIIEKVINKDFLNKSKFSVLLNQELDIDFFIDYLDSFNFKNSDFIYEPGQFSIRGCIIDVFSYSNDYPFRIELEMDKIISLRTFDIASQLSITHFDSIEIIPNINKDVSLDNYVSFLSFLGQNSCIGISNLNRSLELFDNLDEKFEFNNIPHISSEQFFKELENYSIIEFGGNSQLFEGTEVLNFNISPQPTFNKNFDLLLNNLIENEKNNIFNIILSDNIKQIDRLKSIIEDLSLSKNISDTQVLFENYTINEGFIDKDNKFSIFTDHQIFERYHKYSLNEFSSRSVQHITLKEIYNLNKGDFITHIDHGVGRYDGLEKIVANGKTQEAIRLIYAENDILYISIHSLHRISKYIGKEGTPPKLHRLGSGVWNKTKERAKNRVKDIATDLIKLYAKRKSSMAFQFSADNYLQTELEASFIYEDTTDQVRATNDIKKDMEQEFPMDRLVCGDVGFGKTEIAIRAAFKAVCDNKQVAVLVPTTILALQHFKTFSERLNNFPCNIDYINRFKSSKQQKETLQKLSEGEIDIIIGTHRLLSKDIQFKDLGLFVIDEEQKFGVAAKEKLRQIKINVDTLTLTATPIPRTLQFSLLGARDLSIINTPPANRYPIQTEVHPFNELLITNSILFEISRGGQVFFIHNRISNLVDLANMIKRNIPDINVAVAHGQMEGDKLEKTMMAFIDGDYDVLVSTTIVESGLDISNANTIIINEAQNYGLSDLHQMRGRVGRNNKKAFCYLLTPPKVVISQDARKRLKAIEDFSDLGSGFNIALRDLDIRGAGDLLGGEQSGFISDMGYEMFQKIINEAITELKNNEFKNIYEHKEMAIVDDCVFETDLEILIPDEYVSNNTERMALYKELNNVESDEDLNQFSLKIKDIFGNIPTCTRDLILSMKLRKIAKNLGFEKVSLKNNSLTINFVSNHSEYFNSEIFQNVLNFIQKHPQSCQMKQIKEKLILKIKNVNNIVDSINLFEEISNYEI